MIAIQIVDLPKYYDDWKYKPLRPTEILVKLAGENTPSVRQYDAVEPLVLHIGDIVYFNSPEEIPRPMQDLTTDVSGHPIYAVFVNQESTSVEASQQTAASSPEPRFIK